MRFDVFVRNVKIFGKLKGKQPYNTVEISVGAEYDGIHHDVFPNFLHKDISGFNKQKKNDKKKDTIALKNKTYMILLKEFLGFNSKTIDKFQEEIIRQIQNWTDIKLDPMPKWIYDRLTNSLIRDPYGTIVDVPLNADASNIPKRSKGPINKFLY